MSTLAETLSDPSRPSFLFGSTPPREGTTIENAKETALKFAQRSALLATDGFIVYDIQEESSRNSTERPFPFRKTMDPSLYGSFFPEVSGKECIIYKCVVEQSPDDFTNWLDSAYNQYGHSTFNLVGAASSSQSCTFNLNNAAEKLNENPKLKFGCVSIAERHMTKGNEHLNMLRKTKMGAKWFITQGIFDSEPIIKLLHDYSDACRAEGKTPSKVILTFAPCGRSKTMTFIKWLGIHVSNAVENLILGNPEGEREGEVVPIPANPVANSIQLACDLFQEILLKTAGCGVPLGINVESLSIYKEEINGAHELFQKLQSILLTSTGSPWTINWSFVRPVSPRKLVEDEKDEEKIEEVIATTASN